jgi:hypothetical protein
LIGALVSVGAPYADTHALDEPRSAEWTAAALRLAAWADGQATPEEPAPWDEPTVMSDEDIAALVGL